MLIAFIGVNSFLLFFADVQSHYPNAAAADPLLTNLSLSVNQSVSAMDTATNASIIQSTGPTRSLDLTAAVFGYVTGAINAIGTLASTPGLFLNIINVFGSTVGFYIPNFVILAIQAAVYVVALIGILFYLLKVR